MVSSGSAYFRGMFNNYCSENIENKVHLNFDNEALNDIIDYMYSGIIYLTDTNIEYVIEISRYFQVCLIHLFVIYIYIHIHIHIYIYIYIYIYNIYIYIYNIIYTYILPNKLLNVLNLLN